MEEFSNQTTRKTRSFDSIITAINIIAMGAGFAAAAIAASKSKTASVDANRIEKSVNELNSKFDKISEQLRSLQPSKMQVSVAAAKESDRKPDSTAPQQQQPKPQQDVIYVRKSSEFSFYN